MGHVEPNLEAGLLTVGDEPARCGVIGLTQLCASNDPMDWKAIVEHHFELLRDHPLAAMMARLSDYHGARRHLRLRLVPTEVVEEIDGHRVELPTGVSLALALDMDGHCVYVSSQHTTGWQPMSEELMLTAAEQVRRRVRVRKRVRHRFGGRHLHLHGMSLFLTGHLFDLSRHLSDTAPLGALVNAPTAREMLVDEHRGLKKDILSLLGRRSPPGERDRIRCPQQCGGGGRATTSNPPSLLQVAFG